MPSSSARHGVYSMLNQRERLRPGNSNSFSTPQISSKCPVAALPTSAKKKPDKAIGYALHKAKAVVEDGFEAVDT